MSRARLWLWVKKRDLIIGFYGLWLTGLTVAVAGWPWQW